MLSLNCAGIGLLGALKDKGLNTHKYEYLKELDYQAMVDFIITHFILPEYQNDVKDGLEHVEYFMRLSYLRSCCKLLRFLKGYYQEFLKTFLREYDIYNLKIILRAILLGSSYPERLYRFPFSIFYHHIPELDTFQDVIKFLRKEKDYRKIVESGYQEYKRRGEYFYLEIKMEQMWLMLLKSQAQKLEGEVFVKLEKWLAVVYILWGVRLFYLQGRSRQEILSFLDLDNPYLDVNLLENIWNAGDITNAVEMIFSHQELQHLDGEDDWETGLIDSFYSREIEKKMGIMVFSFLPFFKFVFQQRFYVERVIQLLNKKSIENV